MKRLTTLILAVSLGCFDFGNEGPACGNGVVDFGEACDDSNTTDGDGCSAVCLQEALCGNGSPDAGEGCDDGNNVDGDGCSAVCQVELLPADCDETVMSAANLAFCNEILLNLPEDPANCRRSPVDLPTDFCAVSFEAHILPNVANRSSCGSAGCHGAQFPPQGFGVNLSDPASTHSNLLSLATETEGQAQELQRIAPGEPTQSYLLHKLLGDGQPAPFDFDIVGSRMPLAQDPLCKEVIASICFWTAAGASF